MHNKIS